MKKLLALVLAVVMVAAMSLISYAANTVSVELTDEATTSAAATVEAVDGKLVVTTTSTNDPWVSIPVDIDTSVYKYFTVNFRATKEIGGNNTYLKTENYIGAGDGGDWEPHGMNGMADGELHSVEYSIDSGFPTFKDSNITGVRLTACGEPDGVFTIESIIFADTAGAGVPQQTPAGLFNDSDYSVSYVIDKTNATSWSNGQIGDMSVTYFFNVKDDGLEVAVRAIGLVQDNMVQINFNPGNILWETTGQFVSFKLGDTLTVLQHNHKNGLLDDANAGGADITAKVPNQIVKLDNGYEFTAKLPKELFTVTDVEGADSFVYGQDDLYFGMFLVAGGGGISNQQNTDYTDWTCKGLALNQYKFAGTPAPVTTPETQPQTGDATVAMFAVIAVLAMGAAVVFMKKKAF